jgi:uncharacterized protein (TIGR02145 family)
MKNTNIILMFQTVIIMIFASSVIGATPLRTDSFLSRSEAPADTLTDIDGNVYNIIKIGDQIWMKENLNTTRFRNGDAIPTTSPAFRDISGDTEQIYQWPYGGDITNVKEYGRLYTFYAASDSRGVCPSGWHLPSLTEWNKLITLAGTQQLAGGKLKESGFTHWNEPNKGGTDEFGFSALPGGSRNEDGSFRNMGEFGSWWTSTSSDRGANYFYIEHDAVQIFRTYIYQSKIYGFSIRCVKD